MGRFSQTTLRLAVLMMALLGTSAMVIAQDAETPATDAPAPTSDAGNAATTGSGGATSFAKMFFWSDSMVGVVIIWLLVIMSVATVALMIHFLLQNRKETVNPDATAEDVEALLGERKFRDAIDLCEEDPSTLGEIMHAALSEASNGYGAMERAIEETGDLASTRKLRSLEILNVFGAIGPMIGLFGTIYGMIVAFQTIVDSGGKPSPGELAAGISTALVTTFWGLIVGIPAVASAALIRNRIEGLITEAMVEAEGLIGRFRTAGSGKKSSSSKPSRSDKPSASPKPKSE